MAIENYFKPKVEGVGKHIEFEMLGGVYLMHTSYLVKKKDCQQMGLMFVNENLKAQALLCIFMETVEVES